MFAVIVLIAQIEVQSDNTMGERKFKNILYVL